MAGCVIEVVYADARDSITKTKKCEYVEVDGDRLVLHLVDGGRMNVHKDDVGLMRPAGGGSGLGL